MNNQINLDEITSQNELNKLYVQTNEELMQAQQGVQVHSQNVQAIRVRLSAVVKEAEDSELEEN